MPTLIVELVANDHAIFHYFTPVASNRRYAQPVAVDGCITKAPCGGDAAGRSLDE